jgi:hypothetical protein
VPLKVRPSSFRLNFAAVHEDAAFSCLWWIGMPHSVNTFALCQSQ